MDKTRPPDRRYVETQDKSDYPIALLEDTPRACACGAVAYIPKVRIEWRCTSCHRLNKDPATT